MSEPETATLNYQNHAIPLLIRRSAKRRTVGITIDQNGVKVAAPLRMSRKRVLELVATRAGWILEKHLEFQSKIIPAKRFVSGERFGYLGREITICVKGSAKEGERGRGGEGGKSGIGFQPSALSPQPMQLDLFSFDFLGEAQPAKRSKPEKPCARLNGDLLEVFPGHKSVREVLERWYVLEAQRIIGERVAWYAGRLGWPMPTVLIRDQKKRWGSCNAKGELRFNWRLIQTELGIVDYVVVHEMAHLKVLNHSAKYWRLVEQIMPDYQRYHHALNELGAGLYW